LFQFNQGTGNIAMSSELVLGFDVVTSADLRSVQKADSFLRFYHLVTIGLENFSVIARTEIGHFGQNIFTKRVVLSVGCCKYFAWQAICAVVQVSESIVRAG
jgi:hypothetical protein